MPGPANRAGSGGPGRCGSEPILDNSGSVNRDVIPMEKPPLLHQDRPLLPQVLHEVAQDLHDVRCVGGGTPGDDMQVDEALAVEEGEQHLFGPAGIDLSLYWARLTLLNPMLGLLFLSEECCSTSLTHP